MRRISVSYWFVIRTSGLDWIGLNWFRNCLVESVDIKYKTIQLGQFYLRDIFEKLAKESKHHIYKKRREMKRNWSENSGILHIS